MNIQIFGSSKCFDTKKAQRWFKERRIKFQYVDLPSKGLSPREYQSVKQKVGFQALVNTKCQGLGLCDPRRPGGEAVGEPRPVSDPHRPKREGGHRGVSPGGLGNLGINFRSVVIP